MTTARENAWFRGLARHRVSLAATLSHSVQGWRHDARITDHLTEDSEIRLGGAGSTHRHASAFRPRDEGTFLGFDIAGHECAERNAMTSLHR